MKESIRAAERMLRREQEKELRRTEPSDPQDVGGIVGRASPFVRPVRVSEERLGPRCYQILDANGKPIIPALIHPRSLAEWLAAAINAYAPSSPEPGELWSGSWNNWLAPFSLCPRCEQSLNWKQGEDALERPLIDAACCGVHFVAMLIWEES